MIRRSAKRIGGATVTMGKIYIPIKSMIDFDGIIEGRVNHVNIKIGSDTYVRNIGTLEKEQIYLKFYIPNTKVMITALATNGGEVINRFGNKAIKLNIDKNYRKYHKKNCERYRRLNSLTLTSVETKARERENVVERLLRDVDWGD